MVGMPNGHFQGHKQIEKKQYNGLFIDQKHTEKKQKNGPFKGHINSPKRSNKPWTIKYVY